MRPAYLTVGLIVSGLVFVATGIEHDDSYWLAQTGTATRSLLGIAPIAAGWAAFFGGRERIARHNWLDKTRTRARLVPLVATLLPIVGCAGFCVMVILTWTARDLIGAPGWPSWPMLVIALVVATAHGTIGFLLGVLVPRSVAIPAAAMASYFWLAFPRAFEPFWIRNINGELGSRCCDLSTVLAPGAVAGPLILNLALILSGALVIASRFRSRVALISVVIVVAGVVSARAATLNLGADPVTYRTTGVHCDDRPATGLPLCWWTEHAALVGRSRSVIAGSVVTLVDAGFTAPRSVTESGAASGTWVIDFRIPPDGIPEALVEAAVASVVGECQSLDYEQGLALSVLRAYGRTVVASEPGESDPAVVHRVDQLLEDDPSGRRDRVGRLIARVQACAK